MQMLMCFSKDSTGGISVKKISKALSSFLFAAILAGVICSAPVNTSAASDVNVNLPFTVEDTDYGVHDDGVKAKRITLKEDSGAEFRKNYYGESNTCSDGCFFIDEEKDDGSVVSYLVGKNGFVKSYTADSDDFKVEKFAVPSSEYQNSEKFPDELYTIQDPKTGKMDLYNESKDKYYEYEADAIEATYHGSSFSLPSIGSYDYEIGLLLYKKNGKYGLLNCEGEVLYEPIYSSICGYKNALVGTTSNGEVVLSRDGTTDGTDYCDEVQISYNIVWGTRKSYKYYTIYDPDTLKVLLKDQECSAVKPYNYRNKYYFAVKQHSDGKYYSYIISENLNLSLNAAFNQTSLEILTDGDIVEWNSNNCAWNGSVSFLSNDGNHYYQGSISPDGKTKGELVRYDTETEVKLWTFDGYWWGYVPTANGRSKIQFLKKNGTELLPDITIKNITRRGNIFMVLNKDTGLYTYVDAATGKTICSEVERSHSEYAQVTRYLDIVLSQDDSKFGIVDLKRGTFSGFVFDSNGYDRDDYNKSLLIEEVYTNEKHINDVRDLKWICVIKLEDDSENTEKTYFINSGYKLLAEGGSPFYDDAEFLIKKNDITLKAVIGIKENGKTKYCIIDHSGIKAKFDSYMSRYGLGNWEGAVTFAKDISDDDDENYRYGLVTENGYVIVRAQYPAMSIFRNGFALYRTGDYRGILNRDGRKIISGKFKHEFGSNKIEEFNLFPTITLAPDDDYSYHVRSMIIYDYSGAKRVSEQDSSVPDNLPDWHTNNSTFALGEDTNNFLHHNIDETDRNGNVIFPAGFKGVLGNSIPVADAAKLFSKCSSAGEYLNILNESRKKWNGSCYGIASTICLTHSNQINPSSISNGAANYFSMGLPYKNKKFLNTILYYDLSQNLANHGVEESAEFSCDIYNPDYSMPLNRFLQKFVNICRKKSALVLGIDTVTGGGHAVVACGCYTDAEKDKYVVRLFDENSVYSGAPLGEFAYMYIDSDFSDFSIEGDLTFPRHIFRTLTCVDICGHSLVEPVGANAASEKTEKEKMYVEIDAGIPFTIKNDSGDELSFDGTYHTGELYVYSTKNTIVGDKARTIYEIDYSDSLLINPEEESAYFSVYTGKDYYNVEAEKLDSAYIEPGNSISLSGDSMQYSVRVNNPQTKGVELIGFSGKETDSVQIENEDKVTVGSEWNFNRYSGVTVSKIDAEGETTLAENVSFRKAEYKDNTLYLDNNSYTPKSVETGDVNGDGVVNGKDAALLARYTSGWDGYADKVDKDAADINGDGKINGQDSAILMRYTSGWDGYARFFN